MVVQSGFTSTHFVKWSTQTIIYLLPLSVFFNGPIMSMPSRTKGPLTGVLKFLVGFGKGSERLSWQILHKEIYFYIYKIKFFQ